MNARGLGHQLARFNDRVSVYRCETARFGERLFRDQRAWNDGGISPRRLKLRSQRTGWLGHDSAAGHFRIGKHGRERYRNRPGQIGDEDTRIDNGIRKSGIQVGGESPRQLGQKLTRRYDRIGDGGR